MQIQPIDYLEGTLLASPSKSYSHRAFALALMAKTPSLIINPLTEGDLAVTIDFCQKLGAQISEIKHPDFPAPNQVWQLIPPKSHTAPSVPIDGKNSGTSIRLLTALSAVFPGITKIYGLFFNRKRPLKPLLDALAQIGVKYKDLETPLGVELTVGTHSAGIINIPGDISSQFITGLMCLAPNLPASSQFSDTTINITTPAKSYPYLQISEDMLKLFGIRFKAEFGADMTGRYIIPANQSYNGLTYKVPCDFSSAAFILVAAALNPFPKTVLLQNLSMKDPQGDKKIVEILQKAGADIVIDDSAQEIRVTGGRILEGQAIDCSQIPDLFPILCVLGVYSDNTTRIYNAQHVRIKETDRIKLMVRELQKMGATLIEKDDGVIIEGPQQLHGLKIDHEQDHRLAMALTIAGMYARSVSSIEHEDVVKDSYPNFYEDLRILGAKFT